MLDGLTKWSGVGRITVVRWTNKVVGSRKNNSC